METILNVLMFDFLADEQQLDQQMIKKSLDWQQDLQLQSIYEDRKV
jgi:hypothetical protein